MDKYQQAILDKCNFSINKGAELNIKSNKLEIKQCENAYITKFMLNVDSQSIESIVVNEVVYKLKDGRVSIEIDFDNPIENIKLVSVGNITEAIMLELKYQSSDKDVYDEKVRAQKEKEYRENSHAILIKNLFGPIYVAFNPCCDKYAYTEVEFIAKNNQGTTSRVFPQERRVYIGGGSAASPSIEKVEIILERKKNDTGCNYVKFDNIGECGLEAHVYQYDKDGNLLIDYLVY